MKKSFLSILVFIAILTYYYTKSIYYNNDNYIFGIKQNPTFDTFFVKNDSKIQNDSFVKLSLIIESQKELSYIIFGKISGKYIYFTKMEFVPYMKEYLEDKFISKTPNQKKE